MQLFCSPSHTHEVTNLTLPAHTHTVRVLVRAACAVQDHPLHGNHILCLLGLAMQLAAFVSWEIKYTNMTQLAN